MTGEKRGIVATIVENDDVYRFVSRCARNTQNRQAMDRLNIPDGMTADDMWELVEFARHTACGINVCGQNRECGHESTWYALSGELMRSLTSIEYRSRAKSSLSRQSAQLLQRERCYLPMLDDLAFALRLDGCPTSAASLRDLALGIRPAMAPGEFLAMHAIEILNKIPAMANETITEGLLLDMFDHLDDETSRQVATEPAHFPSNDVYRECDLFDVRFIADGIEGVTPVSEPPIMFILFCCDSMRQRDIFPQWNVTMELLIRSLLFEVAGFPALRFAPMTRALWEWQHGLPCSDGSSASNDGIDYAHSLSPTRRGADMTPLFLHMLNILNDGLNELALTLHERRSRRQACKDALGGDATINHRQRDLLISMVDGATTRICAKEYEEIYGIVPSTAYKDLAALINMGYLVIGVDNHSHKPGEATSDGTRRDTRVYFPARNLEAHILAQDMMRTNMQEHRPYGD
jgi:hypothetical protein